MKAILRFDNVDTYREGEYSERDLVTVGREPDNLVALPLNVLSRHHAKVYCRDDAWYVEDLGSANGTFHRGEQLKPSVRSELANGDVVRFGTVAMSISFESAPASGPEKVVEKIVEKEVIKEVPVVRSFVLPKEINGKPVLPHSPEEPGKPFRPGLRLPSDLVVPEAARKIRI